jgi:hypothetical protein
MSQSYKTQKARFRITFVLDNNKLIHLFLSLDLLPVLQIIAIRRNQIRFDYEVRELLVLVFDKFEYKLKVQ